MQIMCNSWHTKEICLRNFLRWFPEKTEVYNFFQRAYKIHQSLRLFLSMKFIGYDMALLIEFDVPDDESEMVTIATLSFQAMSLQFLIFLLFYKGKMWLSFDNCYIFLLFLITFNFRLLQWIHEDIRRSRRSTMVDPRFCLLFEIINK